MNASESPNSAEGNSFIEMRWVALERGQERYIFLYDKQSTPQLLHTFDKFAEDSELTFSWYDAAILSKKVRDAIRPIIHPDQ